MISLVEFVLFLVIIVYIYKALKPPPPKKCGTFGGPPVTSPRIKLRDGRYLAYREIGVSKDEAKHSIILAHGINSSKDFYLPVSHELVEELKLHIVLFDRAGYGESDPYPERSVKSEAYDIQDLADALELGSKFYVVGVSLGGYSAWGCLKYISHRLAGIALVVPFVHYWWPHFPSRRSREAFRKLPVPFQWTFRVAHYAPWLFYWWMTQRWFPNMLTAHKPVSSESDQEIIKTVPPLPEAVMEKVRQQGDYESLHRDIMAGYANWGFSSLDLTNPFLGKKGSAHIWQGYEDGLIPFEINRYIAEKLPWIKYHEVPDGGHLFSSKLDKCEEIIKALVLG